MVELRFSASGHIRLQSLAGSTALFLRQIRQMRLEVTGLEGFDWDAYLYAYQEERKEALWANRWMGYSMIPYPDRAPSWNLELITTPPLMPTVCQMMFLPATAQKPVVILASETLLTPTILSAVMNYILPGVVTDPRYVTWLLYQPLEHRWEQVVATWEEDKEWWWATGYAEPLFPEDVDNIFKGGLP